MKDQYPENINIEVDHAALRKFLRLKYLIGACFPLGIMGCFFGFIFALENLNTEMELISIEYARHLFQGVGSGLLIALLPGIIVYALFLHRLAGKTARALKISVEGSFLRIIQDGLFRIDRKLHFRSIVDYSTVEGKLMRRLGVTALQLTTTGGSPQGAFQIIGIKDCLKVRDLLAEVDSIRENR